MVSISIPGQREVRATLPSSLSGTSRRSWREGRVAERKGRRHEDGKVEENSATGMERCQGEPRETEKERSREICRTQVVASRSEFRVGRSRLERGEGKRGREGRKERR